MTLNMFRGTLWCLVFFQTKTCPKLLFEVLEQCIHSTLILLLSTLGMFSSPHLYVLSLAYSIISVLPRTGVLKAIKKTPGMMCSRQFAVWQNLLILLGFFKHISSQCSTSFSPENLRKVQGVRNISFSENFVYVLNE